MEEKRLIHPDLLWAPSLDGITGPQMEAIRTRHANAIRPIPARTALGHDHLMADADRAALLAEVDRLRAEKETLKTLLHAGDISDGYHTHNELYRFRMAFHAFAVRNWLDEGYMVVKSRRHHSGELPFDGGWFIVVADLPTGNLREPIRQVSNHYREECWDLFRIPAADRAPVWDGHTPSESIDRMLTALSLGL
jgi:hypothetical protein